MELKLVQRLRCGRVTARPEYWGECPTAPFLESVQVRKENTGWWADKMPKQEESVQTVLNTRPRGLSLSSND